MLKKCLLFITIILSQSLNGTPCGSNDDCSPGDTCHSVVAGFGQCGSTAAVGPLAECVKNCKATGKSFSDCVDSCQRK